MKYRLSTLWIVALFFALMWSPQAMAGDWSETDVFVDAADTVRLAGEGALILDARQSRDFEKGRIPQSANLHWQDLVDGSTSGELIDDDRRLTAILRQIGVSNDRPVVVYGNWSDSAAWGEEGRLYWTLDYLGHSQVYILDGGFSGWKRRGGNVARGTQSPSSAESGNFVIDRRSEYRITTDELRQKLDGDDTVVLLDTRDGDEYAGQTKYGEQRPGHIPGAHHLWWRDLVDDDGSLMSRAALRTKLSDLGIEKDSQIIAYCTGGVRSGFVYAVLRAAGFDTVQNYDASMWDWTRHRDTPLQ